MTTATLRQTTSVITMLSLLPHLFCCVLPVMAALVSLGTTVGLAASLASNPLFVFVHDYHQPLLILAVASVAFSGLLHLIAWRLDCRTAAQSSCAHDDCAPKKSRSLKIFYLSCVLLTLDLAWFAVEERVLGVHHHHDHGHSHVHAEETLPAPSAARQEGQPAAAVGEIAPHDHAAHDHHGHHHH